MEKLPAISIIVPMYNTAKYIKQCLESVAAQTFQDYELIVIDDCSTDESVAIVESMAETFGDKLKLIKLTKNSGSPGIPRNQGLKIATGKYITFLDSDDLFIDTALDELYKLAEETQADVLHASTFITAANRSEEFTVNTPVAIKSWEVGKPVKKVTIVSNDLKERINTYRRKGFIWSCWNKFIRRDFLVENKIEFATLTYSEDMPFCFKCLCLAKKYVRIPNVFYMYRYRQGSIQHRSVTAEQIIKMYTAVIIDGMKIFDNFMNQQPFFVENVDYKYMVIEFFMREHLSYFEDIYKKYPVHLIDILMRESLESTFGSNTALISYLFNVANKTLK